MSSKMRMSRRQFAKGTVATAALAATGVLTRLPKVHAADPIELGALELALRLRRRGLDRR